MSQTPAALSEENVAVDGGLVAYWRAGAGPAVVLLHGWTLDRRMWAPQIEVLARTSLVIAPDRRGFGRSSAPPDLSREADDVARLLDAVGVDCAAVVGMSQSGRVALDIALRFEDRIAGLVLQGAPLAGVAPGPGEDEAIPIVEYAALVRAGQLHDMKRRWRAHVLMRAGSAAAAACVDEMLATYDGRDLLLSSTLADFGAQDLSKIGAPALVITGALDTPWRRRGGDALARALANAARVEIEGAGHLCNLCAPAAYNAALERFLSGLR